MSSLKILELDLMIFKTFRKASVCLMLQLLCLLLTLKKYFNLDYVNYKVISMYWLSIDRFPTLCRFGLQLVSMFGSTYVCESAFSAMKLIKSKERNILTQTSLKSCLLLALTSVDINTKELTNRT